MLGVRAAGGDVPSVSLLLERLWERFLGWWVFSQGLLPGPGVVGFFRAVCLQQSVETVLVEGSKAGAAREGSLRQAWAPGLLGFAFSFALV